MHVHPDITIGIVDRERRARLAAGATRRTVEMPSRRGRLGRAVVRLGARLGRFDVVVAGRRGWRGRTVTV